MPGRKLGPRPRGLVGWDSRAREDPTVWNWAVNARSSNQKFTGVTHRTVLQSTLTLLKGAPAAAWRCASLSSSPRRANGPTGCPGIFNTMTAPTIELEKTLEIFWQFGSISRPIRKTNQHKVKKKRSKKHRKDRGQLTLKKKRKKKRQFVLEKKSSWGENPGAKFISDIYLLT